MNNIAATTGIKAMAATAALLSALAGCDRNVNPTPDQ
jgi:hypothetical protein